ncbi:phosphatidylserine decarboxylase-domain-containing protein [Salix suchowensis]|nr:phosphatidylserine decarboxylase-domain-containing protein [Salix suchowensis]
MKFRRASSSVASSSVTASTASTSTPSTSSATTPSSSNLDVGAASTGKKKRFGKNLTHGEYHFDIVGIVMLEIHGADDLPMLKNSEWFLLVPRQYPYLPFSDTLNSKAEMDIVTHLAICASQDWGRVDRIAVGNFVTASQAQRKWYTKIIGKISSGDYRLGANRMTGQLEEEKMQVYVRLGIRLLYKGAKRQMEGGRACRSARGLLKSLSIKQGPKYDAPQSAADIPGFIEFHNLKVDEILDPLDSFSVGSSFSYA